MHFRQKIKEQVSSWGGGLGGSGYVCQICNYVASSVDSLATHAGYMHSLFYGHMSEEMQKEYKEVADKVGESFRYICHTKSFCYVYYCSVGLQPSYQVDLHNDFCMIILQGATLVLKD